MLCGALLSGCVSFHTNHGESGNQNAATEPGIYYYLPKKDIIVTLTVEQKANSQPVYKFDFDTSTAYPNLSRSYRLNQTKQFFADVTDKYIISTSGLLSSVDVKSESKVETVLENLAGTGRNKMVGDDPSACPVGTYVLAIDPAIDPRKDKNVSAGYQYGGELCHFVIGYRVAQTPERKKTSGSTSGPDENESGANNDENNDIAGTDSKIYEYRPPLEVEEDTKGIVYRNDLPYVIEVRSGKDLKARKLVFSPTGAITRILPLKKGFFAQTDHKFVLEDGRLVNVDYKKDSELATVLTAPAKLIGAYTGALGQVLSGIHGPSNERLEADKIEASQRLLKAKIAQCQDALDEGVAVELAQTLCAF